MNPGNWIIGQLIAQLVIANLPWLILGLVGKTLSFPVGRLEDAVLLFPKLQSEYDTLTAVYSADVATRLVLAYANTFVFNLVCFLIGLILFLLLRMRVGRDLNKGLAVIAEGATEDIAKKYKINYREVVKVLLFFLVAGYLVFLQPIAFTPSRSVSHDRVIDSAYSGFVFFFMVFFLLLQCLLLHLLGPKRR